MARLIIVLAEESIRLCGQFLALLLGRWLYALSSPGKDYRQLMATWPFSLQLKWYRGLEAYHQLRGVKLLKSCQ